MIGQNIVLHTDEPTVAVGRPLKRIRIRVNDVIVPIRSFSISGIFIFIELENPFTGSDVVTAQYNSELIRPVLNGIVAVDNAEELKAFTLTLAQIPIGQAEVAASIVLTSFVFANNGQVIANVVAVVAQHGRVLANVSLGSKVAGIGQIFVDVSTNAAQNGVAVVSSLINASQNGAVQSIAAIDLSQNGAVQVVASLGAERIGGQVAVDVLMAVQKPAQVQVAVSTAAKFQGEVQLEMAVEVSQNEDVQVAASMEVEKAKVYVINFNPADEVSVHDASTLAKIGSDIPVIDFPLDIAFTTDKLRGYVVGNDNDVSEVDLVTQLHIISFTLSGIGFPTRIVQHPTAAEVWITNRGGVSGVEVRSTVDNSFVTNIALGLAPRAIVFLASGLKAYVTDSSSGGKVWVLDGTTRTLITTITVGVGKEGFGIAISPDQSKLYVCGQDTNDVTIIDPVTDLVTGQIDIPTGPSGVWSVVFHPTAEFAYVADQSADLIREIATDTDTLTGRTIAVATTPRGMAISPDGQVLYVGSFGSSRLTAIDTATMLVINTFALGVDPVELHFL